MKLAVTIRDTSSKESRQSFNLSLPAIIKHLAFSGCHFMRIKHKIFRCLGMLFHYIYYLREEALNSDRFSLPPNYIYDPTEISQFSNLAGKAIADYLSEKIDKSMFSVSYEVAMKAHGQRIIGARPDLLAFSKNGVFAIEAKGYSNKKGIASYNDKFYGCPSDVQFCVASVSYNMYKKIECSYWKSHPNYIYRHSIASYEIFNFFSKSYYSEFANLVNSINRHNNNIIIETFSNEEFYMIDLRYYLDSIEFPLKIWWAKLFDFYELKLIIPKNIGKYAEYGLMDRLPFEYEGDDSVYISNDRIGLKIKKLTGW